MRVIVTGSRDWPYPYVIYDALSGALAHRGRDLIVVHGDCQSGADRQASDWCSKWGVQQERHPPDWDRHGKAAGFIRNKKMVDLGADVVLAFQKNKSKGTQHTIDLARKAGIAVRVMEE